MVNMKPPRVPDVPPDVLRDDDLKKLLRTCEGGQSFEDRRDAALMRVFIDTGARLSEVTNLRWAPWDEDADDVDLDTGRLRVHGKGNRQRPVSIGNKAVKSLDRYIRRRSQHPEAGSPWLWLGTRGRMTPSGIRQMFWRRGRQAGIGPVHPHQLRHSAAHMWLAEGAGESDLMRLMGWRSRSMIDRYGRGAAEERALAAHKRYGLGDRL
jgi:integrase